MKNMVPMKSLRLCLFQMKNNRFNLCQVADTIDAQTGQFYN